MKVKLIYPAIILIITKSCFSQTSTFIDTSEFIRIEVDQGVFHSLKLFEEGLMCKSVDDHFRTKIEFFPITKLDHDNILQAQKYIIGCARLFNDTTIDDPTQIVYHDNYSFMKFTIFVNENIHTIKYIDGKSIELETCLHLLNKLIPGRKRKLYSILGCCQ
jgi:hypothetical protein